VYNYPAFGREMGASNYIGCGGYSSAGAGTNAGLGGITNVDASVKYKGVYAANTPTRIVAIGDGTSNTIGFGETSSGVYGGHRFRITWMGAGSMPTAFGLVPRGDNGNPYPWQFSSRHSGGVVNIAFCDGSVRSIKSAGVQNGGNTPAYQAYIAVSGANDGVVYNTSNLE